MLLVIRADRDVSDGFSIVVNDRHPLAKRKIVSINDILDYSIILHNYDFSIESFKGCLGEIGKNSDI